MSEYEMGDKLYGEFQPVNQQTLRGELGKFAGEVYEFRAMWLMDESDPFPGQRAFQAFDVPANGGKIALDGYWVPEEDIKPVAAIAEETRTIRQRFDDESG